MINTVRLNSRYSKKEEVLNTLAKGWNPEVNLFRLPDGFLNSALNISLGSLDGMLRSGRNLGVLEAFSGMLHVVGGTNHVLHKILYSDLTLDACMAQGSFFLTRMAAKEQYVGLSPEEVAGMVMAGLLDVVFCPDATELSETSGMGADRGWQAKRVKTINASTLSALVMASMGFPTTKHGSYGNTTKVGSTDVPEQFGANIHQGTEKEIQRLLSECRFWFNDAHSVKTIHYLSHLLMVETVNHVVGPMTGPVGKNTLLFKLMGVNHYVHPETIAKAYIILHRLGVLELGGAVIMSGIRGRGNKNIGPESRRWYSDNAYLDEVSPNLTLVSLAAEGSFYGTHPLDTSKVFGTSFTDQDIQVPNEIGPLMRANQMALTGVSPFAEYLAVNTAFALLAHQLDLGGSAISTLPSLAEQAYEAIASGLAINTLEKYVLLTGGRFVSWQ